MSGVCRVPCWCSVDFDFSAHYMREATSILAIGTGNVHIVEIYQAWQEDGHFCIQMEFCPVTLQSLIGSLPALLARYACL